MIDCCCASPIDSSQSPRRITRRAVIATMPLLAIMARRRAYAAALLDGMTTVDMHSHAGSIIGVLNVRRRRAFSAVAEPMRTGGMAVLCLAIVSDSPCQKVMPDGRIHPFRQPERGELYRYAQQSFERLGELIRREGLAIITDAAALRAARAATPSAIVASEGGDFLEGDPDRVDEAYERYHLRHLQLTHYRVNELGDIQTEYPAYGGLTDAGAAVIRRCNKLGIVVDVAHGTYELVKRAATVSTKPLLLSHTSFTAHPGQFSRQITSDHARAIAATGGVIGIWPPRTIFRDLRAMARGVANMAEVVGVEHVGLGTDMLGLVGGSVFDRYERLPDLVQELLHTGFSQNEIGMILGGNYARVFETSLA